MNDTSSRDVNPYQAPAAAGRPAVHSEAGRDNSVARKISVAVMCFVIFVGTILSFVNIYSIVYSGAVLALVSLFVMVVARQEKRLPIFLFGLSGIAFSLLIFGLINLMNWGPSDARYPVPRMIVFYAVPSLFFGIRSAFSAPKGDNDGSEPTIPFPQQNESEERR